MCRFGYEENCTRQDPLSYPSFRKLAEPLPFSKRVHSQLVCYITKELMDDHNPPLVLPNGYAYSRKVRVPCFTYSRLWHLRGDSDDVLNSMQCVACCQLSQRSDARNGLEAMCCTSLLCISLAVWC